MGPPKTWRAFEPEGLTCSKGAAPTRAYQVRATAGGEGTRKGRAMHSACLASWRQRRTPQPTSKRARRAKTRAALKGACL